MSFPDKPVKKTPGEFLLRGSIHHIAVKIYFLFLLISACAAASLAIGTRKGEQDT